jgi:hypothetical protein
MAATALRFHLRGPLPLVGAVPQDGYTRVPGVVHVHTRASDGSGSVEDVARAAHTAGARFVVITDHNTLDAKPAEGYHGDVLVLVGTEVSTTAGHVLGLGIRDPVFRFSGDALDAIDDIRHLGGAVAFAAHPVSPRAEFAWTGWSLPGRWGMELLNGDSQWREAGWPRLLATALRYPLNPRQALLRSLSPPDEALARWDGLLAVRNAPALAGADAHARMPVTKTRTLPLPGYEPVLALAQNHVLLKDPLTGDAARDGLAITSALEGGRSYIGLDALAPANAFFFEAVGADGRRATMGESIADVPSPRLRAGGAAPEGAVVRLLRNGRVIAEQKAAVDRIAPGPGVYRVEVRVPGWDVPWVITNPIAVFGADALRARADRADRRAEASAPPVMQVIDDFDGPTAFAAAHDASSLVDAEILARHGGLEGSGAARLRFRLAVPDGPHPDPYCALIANAPRDLSGREGLVFSIRADGDYRIWVQVRDRNPASAEQQTEWWFASVRTDGEWRQVTLPFARFRSLDPASDGRLDLDKIAALVFLVDRGADRPGTAGTIWIDGLGAY